MNVLSKRPFSKATIKYPNDRNALMTMYKLLRVTDFKSPDELKAVYPSLNNLKYKKGWWVIDVGGNNIRVMAFIQFVNKRMYIKHIVNHAEYEMAQLAIIDAYEEFMVTAHHYVDIESDLDYQCALKVLETILETTSDTLDDPLNPLIDLLSNAIENMKHRIKN